MLKKIIWMYRRATIMPAAEYVSRLFHVFRDLKDCFLLAINVYPDPLVKKKPVDLPSQDPCFSMNITNVRHILSAEYRENCLKEAETYLNHKVSIFELKNYTLGPVINWNLDYRNNVETPMRFAAFQNFRSFNNVGDIKYVFEINKHQELPRLAQAYLIDGDSRYVEELIWRIETWMGQCPYMKGINWSSPTVSAYRLSSWTIAYELLKKSYCFPEDFFEKWCKSVFQHIHFISKNYSLYSSAGNHLISEATGVFVACLRWKCFFSAKERKFLENAEKRACSILIESMASQFLHDGVNCEQAASYQLFATQQMFLAYWIGKQTDKRFPYDFSDRLFKAGEFLADILNSRDQPPNYGDEDGAWAFRLSGHSSNKYRELIDLFAVLFGKPMLVQGKKDGIGEAAYWFFGPKAAEMPELAGNVSFGDKTDSLKEKFYPYGGYYLAQYNRCSEKEVLFFLDAGPLGISSTGGHGHSDALSFCLSVGGYWIFVDSGTYIYKDTLDRKRLRSTSAHNTLCFGEEKSQDEYLGPFLWGKRHSARGEISEPGVFKCDVKWFSGEIHKRVTRIRPGKIIVDDYWQGSSMPKIAMHINPELKEMVHNTKNGGVFIETDTFRLQVECERKMALQNTFISPSFYTLEKALKIMVFPDQNEGRNEIKIQWDLK